MDNHNNHPVIFSYDSKPFGYTLGEWIAKWWQWIFSIDKTHNPGNDMTGKYCGHGQDGPILFLT